MFHKKLQWMGELPSSWQDIPLSEVLEEVKTKNFNLQQTHALKFTYGNIVKKPDFEPTDDYVLKTIRNYYVVKPNDIVINGLNLNFDFITKRVGLVKDDGAITSAYIALRIKKNCDCVPLYITYLLKSYDAKKVFHNMGEGVRKILTFSELRKLYIPCPGKEEQLRIANFINKKLNLVENNILNIEKSISILKKYKYSIITQAVTKGLDPNVEMKDSGVEWIGNIPTSWQIIKLKNIVVLNNIKNRDPINPYIGLENIESESGTLIGELSFTPEGDSLLVKKNQVIFGKLRPYLAKCFLSDKTYSCSTEFLVFTPMKVYPGFLKYMLLNQTVINEFKRFSYGAKMPRIDPDYVMNTKFALPLSEYEQKRIAKYIDDKCNQIDKLISQKKFLLTKIEEYKKSLIYEYVTGKKTVEEN